MKYSILRRLIVAADKQPFRFLLTTFLNRAAAKTNRGKLSFSYDSGFWFFHYDGVSYAEGRRFNFSRWHLKGLPERVKQWKLDNESWYHLYRPKTGDIVVDVGAELGTDTILFSRAVGPSGKVIAIEAHPETFARLEATVQANQLTNVVLIHAAVADKKGELRITRDESMESNYLTDKHDGTLVNADTLDNLLHSLDLFKIDFLKMNIEGAEQLAIKGMTKTILKLNNVVIACHDFLADQKKGSWFRTKETVRNYLESHGFEISQQTSVPPHAADHLHGTRK